MIYIVLSILFFTGIFLVFKIAEKLKLPAINIIVINYFFAAIIGNLQTQSNPLTSISQDWFFLAAIIGILFFVLFIIIGISTKLVGLSITTVAGKMSVVIPIIFSIIYYNEDITQLKVIGIILAFVGVILTIYKNSPKDKSQLSQFLIPLLLFIGMGLTDSLFKYTENRFIDENNIALFNSSLFYISFFSSLIYVLITKQGKRLFEPQIIIWGLLLGIVNFYGVFFFMKALGSKSYDSSIIFGINNVSIVVLSVLLGIIIFKEKISKMNTIGVASSVFAIILMSLS